MTQAELGFEGLKIAASLAMALFAYFVVYRTARLEKYRQDLFIIRNRLWDQMRERKLLDAPAHRRLRDTLNAFIRAAPYTNLLVLWLIGRRSPGTDEISISELIEHVEDAEARQLLLTAQEATTSCLMRHLFIATAPGCFVGLPLLVYVFLSGGMKMVRSRVRAGVPWRGAIPFQPFVLKLTRRVTLGTLAVGHSNLPSPI